MFTAVPRTRTKEPGRVRLVNAADDDHVRLAYAEIQPDEKGVTAAGYVSRAAENFARHGNSRIKRVIYDNAFT